MYGAEAPPVLDYVSTVAHTTKKPVVTAGKVAKEVAATTAGTVHAGMETAGKIYKYRKAIKTGAKVVAAGAVAGGGYAAYKKGDDIYQAGKKMVG